MGNAGSPQLVVTISPIGRSNNSEVTANNNGADFGPDTVVGGIPTSTGGIQEALNAVEAGGIVLDIGGGGTAYPYLIANSIYATGSGQTVIFQGSSVLQLQATNSISGNASVFNPFLTAPGGTLGSNVQRVRWLGNGATIDANNVVQAAVSGSTIYALFGLQNTLPGGTAPLFTNPCTNESEIDGFYIKNIIFTGVACLINGGPGNQLNPAFAEQSINDVALRRLHFAYNTATSGSVPAGYPPSGMYFGGAVAGVTVEDCTVDFSLPTGETSPFGNAPCIFVRSEWGKSRNINVRRCNFMAAKGSGEAIELQGSSSQSGVTTEYIVFEDCYFLGNEDSDHDIYIDDNNSTSYPSWINNVSFLRCRFVDCYCHFETIAWQYSTQPWNGYPLGRIRFEDCDFGTNPPPNFFNGTLTNRSPGQSVIVPTSGSALNVMGNGVDYINGAIPTDVVAAGGPVYVGFDWLVTVYGGVVGVNGIKVDGVDTGLAGGQFLIKPGHKINVTWTSGSPPTVTLIPL